MLCLSHSTLHNTTQRVINPGIGEQSVKSYHSLVQYHCATPVFHETVKLAIPPEMMRTARVRFYMYHKSTIICEYLYNLYMRVYTCIL